MLKEKLEEDEQNSVSESTAALIMSSKANLSLDHIEKLSRLIYSSNWEPKFVFKFSNLVSAHETFESHFLSHFILFCHKTSEIAKEKYVLLETLTQIITSKNPIPKNGYEINFPSTDSPHRYLLEFTFAMKKTGNTLGLPKLVEDILLQEVEHVLDEEFNLFVWALICYPSIKPVENAHALTILRKIIEHVSSIIESITEEGEPQSKKIKVDRSSDFKEKLGFILCLTILSSRQFTANIHKDLPWELFESMILSDATSKNISFLRAADFYLTIAHQTGGIDILTTDLMTHLYQGIGHYTYSPYREVRKETSTFFLSSFFSKLKTYTSFSYL